MDCGVTASSGGNKGIWAGTSRGSSIISPLSVGSKAVGGGMVGGTCSEVSWTGEGDLLRVRESDEGLGTGHDQYGLREWEDSTVEVTHDREHHIRPSF